jgi:hypothetical protein
MDHTAPEKTGSRHNPQHVGWLIHGSVPSFSPKTTNEAVGLSHASVDDKLLGLLDPYHQHAIGTFNTYSWGPTHRSLTDTGGGYNLRGASFPRTTLQPSQLAVSTFHQRVSPDLQFNPILPKIPKFKFKGLMTGTWSFDHSVIYHILHLCLAIANDLCLAIGSIRIDRKVILM